jgi:hypothetical protein
VLLLCLFGFLLTLGWSLLTPAFFGPDELAHADMVYEQQATGTYPTTMSYKVHDRLRQAQRLTVTALHRTTADPRAKTPRPALDSWPDARIGWNQMTQHPPFGYVLPAVTLRLVHFVSDPATWAYDRFLFVARLLSALALVPVPLLVVATARRVNLSWPTAAVAALLPFAIPQLTYIGGVVTNDTMLVLLGAAIVCLVARVVTDDRTRGTAIALGVVVGLALLTKAFALMLLPTVAVAYVPRLRTRAAWELAIRRSALFAGIAAVTGGWWWVRNVVREGAVQPQHVIFPPPPAGFVPLPMSTWLRHFGSLLTGRFWGSFGHFEDGVRLAPLIVAIATVVAVALIVLAFVRADAATVHFGVVVLLLGGLVTASVLAGARGLHVDHGLDSSGIQGRYLFVVVPGLAVLAAIGLERATAWGGVASRRLPAVALVLVVVMQLLAVRVMFDAYWGARGANIVERIRAFVTWSPLPGGLVALWAVAMIAVSALLVRELVRIGARPAVQTRPARGRATRARPVPEVVG